MTDGTGSPPATDARRAFQAGVQLHADGKLEGAVDAYRTILKDHPRAAGCWSNLGTALRTLGRQEEGLAVLREGARLCPEAVDLNYNLGNALADAGDQEGALSRYRAVLARKPDHLHADIACGQALIRLERLESAVEHLRAALRRHPDNVTLYHVLGWTLRKLQRPEPAAAACRRALAIGGAPADCHANLHVALSRLGRYEEDERQLRDGLAHHGDVPGLLTALGQSLIDQGRLDRGLEYCGAALAIDPDHIAARLGRSRAHFLAGRYALAWSDYRWRRRLSDWRAPNVAGRQWEGQALDGRSILLHSEQGLGDVIQFVRYAPLLAQRGARVVLYCPPRLTALLRRLPEVAQVIPADSPCPRADWICSLLDVPAVLGTDVDSIPGRCPYLPLHTSPRPLLPPTRRFRIGIVWAGNPANGCDRLRSCRTEDFAPLLDLPGVEWMSFQVGPGAEALHMSGWRGMIRDAGDALTPFEATADALAEVDLVITVDTAMAHLAGALGRPVWTLLSFAPDWRWMLDRIDTPWYPTMRLFRQPAPNDWAGAFREVRRALAARLTQPPTGDARAVDSTPAAGRRLNLN